MQRYFLTTEATYETLRQSLNAQLAYPNSLGKSVFQTALYAPRDGFRRVLLAVDTSIPNYAAINTAIAPLLDSDAMEEIDEATYLAAVASATAGASAWDDITGKPTAFAPSAHTHTSSSITDFASAVAAASPEEVVEYTTTALFPASGNSTLLYIATDASRAYRWTGSAYVEVGPLASYVTPVPASSVSGLASVATSGSAADLSGTLNAARLPTTVVTAGSYGSASSVATFTVDATGRLTFAGSTAIAITAGQVSGLGSLATQSSVAYSSLTGTPSTFTPSSHAGSHASGGSDAISLAASQITTGTIATARLGSGTASSSTFLRGDQTYATIAAGNVSGLATSATTDTTNANNISSGTLSASRLPTTGVTAGTYTSVSVDTTGRVTAGSNPSGGVKLGLILALQ